MTLASVLGEKEKVLFLDLQENSGLSQLIPDQTTTGLEELLVMAESGTYSTGRMVSCIGHMEHMDYVYPVENSECLCETGGAVYQNLIQVLAKELNYETVIINLGSRFSGFFDMMNDCQSIYLMKSSGALGQWRQKEFRRELELHGFWQMDDRIHEMSVPIPVNKSVSCESLIKQWEWNEFGDYIRRMIPEVAVCG